MHGSQVDPNQPYVQGCGRPCCACYQATGSWAVSETPGEQTAWTTPRITSDEPTCNRQLWGRKTLATLHAGCSTHTHTCTHGVPAAYNVFFFRRLVGPNNHAGRSRKGATHNHHSTGQPLSPAACAGQGQEGPTVLQQSTLQHSYCTDSMNDACLYSRTKLRPQCSVQQSMHQSHGMATSELAEHDSPWPTGGSGLLACCARMCASPKQQE